MTTAILERYFYSDSVANFLYRDTDTILGILAKNNEFALEGTQCDAWIEEIRILKESLRVVDDNAYVYMEFSIPRLGKRVDAILVCGPVVFVVEFKVGETDFPSSAIDQVWDYAIDLKNFHETSHECVLAPILISTEANECNPIVSEPEHSDRVLPPILCNPSSISAVIQEVLTKFKGRAIDATKWQSGRYSPTPTIVEAATALYSGHSVAEISRSDAGATNLTSTTEALEETLRWAQSNKRKAICFVTGVPGAGKTLVGLNVATQHIDKDEGLHAVFLSGNGPLVAILREALARDKVRNEKERGRKVKKGEAMSEVKMFIQNVHHFRDECLLDADRPPVEHVAIFDEAQRAWNLKQTADFMKRKKNRPNFQQSEPEFLISCLDRHEDWGVVICLVGGGQEINTGEAGISEWIESVRNSFPNWHLFISSRLVDSEYAAGNAINLVHSHPHVTFQDELHLGVSMRSFRAENVSAFVKALLDLNTEHAKQLYKDFGQQYPIVITRDLSRAKGWLRNQARGSERYGIVVSSEAQRLRPHAIDVRPKVNPIHWFLNGKDDVRSSFYLEDVVTEFQVQGLELDWTCLTWDADFRRTESGWAHWAFRGSRWNRIRKPDRQEYLKNAYRVLLTRARQGMVIVVPEGDSDDPTREPAFYDMTYDYLARIGLALI